MWAAVYRGKDTVGIERVPVPAIKGGEILVKVGVCGVCPTDIKKIRHGTVEPPRIFGHETAGTVVRMGALVRGFRIGQRVALHHHVPCLKCHYCQHRSFAQCAQYRKTGVTGGFEPSGGVYAEYVRVLPFALPGAVKVPAQNSLLEAAMLEPVNTVLKAVRRLELRPGDRVAVVGQGPIGLLFTRILRLSKVSVVAADLVPRRLALSKKLGAALTVQSGDVLLQAAQSATRGRGFDAVVLAVSSDAMVVKAQDLVRGGGKILLFSHTLKGGAIGVDPGKICVDEKALIGSYSSDFTLQREVARLVFSRALDVRVLVTDLFPLQRIMEAIGLAETPTEASLKVMVEVSTTNGIWS